MVGLGIYLTTSSCGIILSLFMCIRSGFVMTDLFRCLLPIIYRFYVYTANGWLTEPNIYRNHVMSR